MTASANASVTVGLVAVSLARRDGIVGRAGQSLAELHVDFLVAARREQRVDEALPLPFRSKDAGSHSDSKPCRNAPT